MTLDALLAAGVAEGVFPSARACVLHRGQVVFSGGTLDEHARFDLASVSKVVSTTALVAHAINQGVLSLDTKLGELFPEAGAKHVTVRDLLLHRAGLAPYKVWFAEELNQHPGLFEATAHTELRAAVRADMLRRHVALEPVAPVGAQAVYSDISFILLGAVVERVLAAPLEVLFETHVARVLGLEATGYRRVSECLPPDNVVPTQDERPREPAPGQEGMWQVTPHAARLGDVDDDNCFAMDGVSGHAGLFGTARDVARFGQAVLDERVQFPEPFNKDNTTPGSTRTLGFDTPSAEGASCGPRFGARSIGHTGFTGTSLWIDPDRELVVALLTNRTRLGRANLKIRTFRPRFHDAVIDTLA